MLKDAVYLCFLLFQKVVHIDLGIAFEQGLFLQTPERVPFRLTQNVVDGMGAAGTEGTFRRCCETALQVGGLCGQGTDGCVGGAGQVSSGERRQLWCRQLYNTAGSCSR